MLSTQEVASVLDISPQAVQASRGQAHRHRGDSISTPSQLGSSRATTRLLASGYLDVLGDHDPLMQVVFMLNPNDRLDGQRPLDLLHAGRLDES